MKITESMRRQKAWELIQEAAEDASMSDVKSKTEALDYIYRVAHTMGSPKCRKNHAEWMKPIDAAIRSERRGRKK